MWGLLQLSVAWAGSGPWVLGPGQGALFVGIEGQRFTRLSAVVGGQTESIDIDDGISGLAVKAIGTLGLSDRIELEGSVPWWDVRASRTDGAVCASLGLGACRSTSGLGVIEARGKLVLLDELFGPPLTLSVGWGVRWGTLTSDTRHRLTNIGEGTLDLGPFVALGRSGALGSRGLWSGWLEVVGRGRLPNTDAYPSPSGGVSVPGSELLATAEILVGPSSTVSLGPLITGLWRPGGLDWGELDLTAPDRLGALRVSNLRIGGTWVLRGAGRISAAGWVLGTVAAVNNPSDVLSVGFGVQVPGPTAGRG